MREYMSRERMAEIVDGFKDRSILVVGDFCLDGYWFSDQTRAEASVETGLFNSPITEQRYSPGAAGNIAWNLSDMGVGNVYAVGVAGNDPFGPMLLFELKKRGVDTSHFLTADGRTTPCYMKIFAVYGDITHEKPRVDFESRGPIGKETERLLMERLEECISKADAVIVNDQGRKDSLVTRDIESYLMRMAAEHGEKRFIVDSRKRLPQYVSSGMILKPNAREMLEALGEKMDPADLTKEDIVLMGRRLKTPHDAPLYVTWGPRGVFAFDEGRDYYVPTTMDRDKTDPVGAGDTMIATLAASLSSGATPLEAAILGNMATSVTVKKFQITGTASPREITARYDDFEEEVFGKIERFEY